MDVLLPIFFCICLGINDDVRFLSFPPPPGICFRPPLDMRRVVSSCLLFSQTMSLSCPALRAPARRLCGLTTFQRRLNSSDPLKSLADKFRDPSTPYYIAPGTRGPASEDDHQSSSSSSSSTSKHDASLTLADQHARQHGYDVGTRILVPVAWGEQDMFRHVNNVHFGRYFEVRGVVVVVVVVVFCPSFLRLTASS